MEKRNNIQEESKTSELKPQPQDIESEKDLCGLDAETFAAIPKILLFGKT